ncbi:MAG: hypothetical protein DK306_001642 [Chloroflexi bacterium]|nr:MAG: hypothetical protein DK306_001642 [Chloroflexota bacterium]
MHAGSRCLKGFDTVTTVPVRLTRLLPIGLIVLALLLLADGGVSRTAHAGKTECSPPNVLVGQFCVPPPTTTPPAQLIVTKVVVGGPALPSDFAFLVTVGGAAVTGQQSPPVGLDSTTFVLGFNAVVTVEETVTQPNYTVDNSNCVNVIVALGLVTRCTVTNTYVPPPPPPPPPPPVITTFTIAKQASPADGTPFAFSTSAGGANLRDGEQQTFTVAPGAHFAREVLPVGWELASASCNGADPGLLTGAEIAVTITAGEQITCTFHNTEIPPPPPPPAPPPALDLVKLTNGLDVTPGDGDLPELVVGEDVVWTYRVTNTGQVSLFSILVVDDAGTPEDQQDDFVALRDATLAPGESIEVDVKGLVIAGQYVNTATASGEVPTAVTASLPFDLFRLRALLSTDASGYMGLPPPRGAARGAAGDADLAAQHRHRWRGRFPGHVRLARHTGGARRPVRILLVERRAPVAQPLLGAPPLVAMP